MKTPQVKPDWATGIYIGNGVVAEDIRSKVARMRPRPTIIHQYNFLHLPSHGMIWYPSWEVGNQQ